MTRLLAALAALLLSGCVVGGGDDAGARLERYRWFQNYKMRRPEYFPHHHHHGSHR